MKPHDSGVNQWGMAFNNNNVSHNKRIVNAPQRTLEYEKNILCLKILNCNSFNYNLPFTNKRHEVIYNLIEPFYRAWETIGFNTENFIQYATESRVLENCGGADYLRNTFQNLEYEGGIPL